MREESEGHYSQMSALQSRQIFTRDDVKPSGPNSHLSLILSQENYRSGDEAEGSKGDVRGEVGGGWKEEAHSLEKDELKSG